MRERREALGGYLPTRRRKVDEPAAGAAARDVQVAARAAPTSARSRPRWRSCASSPRSSGTRRWARGWCRSSPTSRAPSGWRGCSASSGSTRTSASCTSPRTPAASCSTARTARARCSRRGSPRRARSPRGSPPPPPTRTTTSRWSPSTPSTRCSASSGSATSPGRPATTRARGFLIGGTAGRTTLNGEGLQHEDGHSHVLAATIPNCISYDPAYAYELAVIVHEGLRRMIGEQEDVFYYLTVMNENYRHPPCRRARRRGSCKGCTASARSTARRCDCSARARSCARSRRRRTCCARTSRSRRRSGA